MKTKEIKRFKFRDDAAKHARDVNAMLESIGEALDKFAFTKHDKSNNASGDWVVEMTYDQEPPKAKPKNAPKNAENNLRAMKNADNFHIMKTAKNRGQDRVWLEGKKLANYGFSRGDMLKKSFSESGYTLVFTKTENPLSGQKYHRIAGTEKRPILDCNGKWVTEFFQGAEFYAVEITYGKITIQPVPKNAIDLF